MSSLYKLSSSVEHKTYFEERNNFGYQHHSLPLSSFTHPHAVTYTSIQSCHFWVNYSFNKFYEMSEWNEYQIIQDNNRDVNTWEPVCMGDNI